jgi:hypothetical protein
MIQEQLRDINAGQIQNGMIVGPAFATVRDLVLHHGRAYTSKPLPQGAWSRDLQACYANALHAAMTGKWVYVEGFAIPEKGDLAMLHAWVTNPKSFGAADDGRYRAAQQENVDVQHPPLQPGQWQPPVDWRITAECLAPSSVAHTGHRKVPLPRRTPLARSTSSLSGYGENRRRSLQRKYEDREP